MNPPTITLIVHAWNQPGRLARLLATLPPEVVQVIVSHGQWVGAGGTTGGGPADRRLPAHVPARPQVPEVDALTNAAHPFDPSATARVLAAAVLPPGVERVCIAADGDEAASRLAAVNRASGEWVVLLDPYDLPPRGWWETLVSFLDAHPNVGALSVPTTQVWWGGDVRDQHFTYRTVALRRNAVYGIPFGSEYDVHGPQVTAHFAPIERDVMGDAQSAEVAAVRAARGMAGDVLRELFRGVYDAAAAALQGAHVSGQRQPAVHKVLDAGAAWMVLTGGPAPAFTWRDGTLVAPWRE